MFRTKCNKTEEEEMEEEFRNLFPSFHESDFKDFQAVTQLTDDEEEDPKQSFKEKMSWEDADFVVNLHIKLMLHYTRTEWLDCDNEDKLLLDVLGPIVEKMKICNSVLQKNIDCVNYRFDTKVVNVFNVLVGVAENNGEISQLTVSSPTHNAEKKKNFYKDANVEEVKLSYHILVDLKAFVSQLLREWPEHPTLQTVIENRTTDNNI